MKTLTVFTPAYNRANLLPRLYRSLCVQTCQDFKWLVVDDGSTDETRKLVAGWIDEGRVEIKYVHKQNGGMHTAHNLAYSLMDSEINTCIDSDDGMPPDAVETIVNSWKCYCGDPDVAGLVGLDYDMKGKLIGSPLPEGEGKATLGWLYLKGGVTGDKKLVYRNAVTREFPRYPEFMGERLVPLSWLYTLIDQKYKLVCVNKPFANVEYQADGSSATVIKQYFQSPRGFREVRAVNMTYGEGLRFRLRNAVHYGVSSFILGEYAYVLRSPRPFTSLLLFPVSILAYYFLCLKFKGASILRSLAR